MTDPTSPPDPGPPGTAPGPSAAASDLAAPPPATDGPPVATAVAPPVASVMSTIERAAESAEAGAPAADQEAGETGAAIAADRVRIARLVRGPALRHAGGYGAAALVGMVLTAVVLLGFGVAGGSGSSTASGPAPGPSASPGASARPPESSPRPSANPADGMVLGDAQARVSIEVWADFQCPYCALLARGVEPSIVRAYVDTGEATLTYHDFAFLGQESIDAAAAARCAGEQGEFWRYHDLLYAFQQGENQGAFGDDLLKGMAGFAGLDQAAFDTCLAAGTAKGEVAADTSHGTTLGVSSTPTLRFIGPAATLMLRGVPQWEQIVLTMDRVTGRAPLPGPSGAASAVPARPVPGASGAVEPAASAPTPGTPAP